MKNASCGGGKDKEMAQKAQKKPTEAQIDLDREAKKRAISTAMSQIERSYGAGSIMKLGENTHMEVQAVHTGSLSLH